MDWSAMAAQLCLELTFGVLLALSFVPRAPVGVFFYRLMTAAALAVLLLGVGLPVLAAGAPWDALRVLVPALALLVLPLVAAGPRRGGRWWGALLVAMAVVAAGVAAHLAVAGPSREGLGGVALVVGTVSALATGAVAGSVALAMVLGHWYLTVPKLEVAHLRRLNRVTAGTMVASLVLVAFSCLVFRERLAAAEVPLLGPWGLFYLGTRVAVGLILPLVFAWMTSDSLRFGNTRSATGILYASTVLVLIGSAASLSLQDSYGVPL